MPHQNLWRLMPIENEFQMSLYRMMKRGIRVDQEQTKALQLQAEESMQSVTDTLGFRASEKSKLEPFLLEELGLPVLKRSPKTGKPSFDKSVMEEYDLALEARNDPNAKLVLEFRGWQKASSSFYGPYIDLLSPDGRLRAGFKIHGTRTGRLSCEKPNLQQIPRKGKYPWNDRTKQCFIPEDGFELYEFDYKTLEFRIAAMYAGNGELITRINDGQDLHQATVDMIKQIVGLQYERQTIKTTNFLKLYGGGRDKLALQLGIKDHTRKDLTPDHQWDSFDCTCDACLCLCESCIVDNAWNTAFPEMRFVMRDAAKKAKEQKYVTYWSGRRKHYGTYWNKGAEHKAFNALCQGGGAEIVKHALVNCKSIESESVRPVLTVHDSLVWEIRPGEVDDTISKVSSVMKDFKFPVKLDVDAHKWGEG
jgi:DNA polymerase-1